MSTSNIWLQGGKLATLYGMYVPQGSFSVLVVNGFQEDNRRRSSALVLIPSLLQKHMAETVTQFQLAVLGPSL